MLLPDAGRGIFHRAALFQRVLEILLNVPDTGSIHHPDGILKVMVQAAVVQIDGAHHRFPAIHHEHLCMDKTRAPLADLHARIQQGRIVALCQCVGELLVRLSGQDEVDIHAPFSGKFQGGLQFAVQNKVGGHNVDVIPGPVEQVDIDHLAHPLAVQRAVAVGDDKAVGLRFREGAGEELRELRLALDKSEGSEQDLKGYLTERLLRTDRYLENGTYLISVMAITAPLLGLLGTVTGMVTTFRTITLYGNSNPVLMADGISEALITTQSGLLIAFPLTLLKQRPDDRIEHIRQQMELGFTFILHYKEASEGGKE